MTAAPFSHRDDGTPEAEWQHAIDERMPALRDLGPRVFETLGHLVVVAAHPDDETLGAAGLIARAGASEARVTVIVATSGEGSHPGAAVAGGALARQREDETRSALLEVDPGASVWFLRLPDGALGEHRAALARAIVDAVGPGTAVPGSSAPATMVRHRGTGGRRDGAADAATVLVAPWAGDRHPDHAAAADAAHTVAQRTGLALLGYPIWLWHWARPDDEVVPWPELHVLPLGDDVRAAKARAIAAHTSQVQPLGDAPGEEALLHAGMLAHFARVFELFVAPSGMVGSIDSPDRDGIRATIPSESGDSMASRTDVAPGVLHDDGVAADYFDRLHESAEDPWGFESRWYEERKRDILLASLPDRRYAEVLEVGSSTGVLSRALAERASGRLVGVDVSAVAVARARERNGDLIRTSFERMHVPAEWPTGAFDLVVVSEVGYYLDPPDLTGVIERILESLTPQGAVVCCHWRHPVAGRTVDGDAVHAAFAARPEFTRLARHLEADFVLDVLVRAPGESVARREGIV